MPTLGIFAKRPVAGAVKTRLAAAIGDEAAARFYEVSLRTLLTRLRGLDLRRVIAHLGTSDEDLTWFGQFEGYERWPQPPGDLGKKLAAWFDFAGASDDRLLVIGSDSPTLPLKYITSAIDALDTADCVIGPALDGGYYLLGLRRPVPELFQDIEWSSSRVVKQTLARAAESGLRVTLLPPWNDVDEVADLGPLNTELEALQGDPIWRELRAVVSELVPDRPGQSITFRRATLADADAVASILWEASRWLEARGDSMWREGELDLDQIREGVATGEYVVAEAEGEPVGTLRFQLRDDQFWHDSPVGDAAYVHRLAVRRSHAGGRLSHQLLEWAADEARQLERRYLRLDCDITRSRLRDIYEQFGFRYHSDRQAGQYLVARYELDLTGPYRLTAS